MTNVIHENCKPASSYSSVSVHDPVKIRLKDGESRPITLQELFETTVKNHGNRPAFAFQDDEQNWVTRTYQDYWDKSRQIARALVKLGLKPRTSCGILAYNCPEWFYTQMAAISIGGISTGIYLTSSAEAVFHVLDSSMSTVCVVDDSTQMAKVRAIIHRLPNLKTIIQVHGPYEEFIDTEEGYYSWPQIEAMGANDTKLDLEVEERLKQVVANECIMLIYTSGTVGMPKGVMLSHDNIITATINFVKCYPNISYGQEVIVSYLPMSHVAAQFFDFFFSMVLGACVYIADRNALKGTLTKTLVKAQPTRFFGVPRIYEKMQEKLIAAEQEMAWLLRFILGTARNSVANYHLALLEDASKPISSWGYWLASKIVRRFQKALGFNQCKTFLAGAAPSSIEMKKFFLSIDIKVLELYGLSEAAGPTNLNPELTELRSCGAPMPGVEMKVDNADEHGHGEICYRSRIVFMGYLHEPEKTKEAISEDGWLHTGDVGYTDSKERLYITARLKELIVTSGGENIPPVHIELLILRELPGLSNAMVIGDRRNFLTILVTIKTNIDLDSGKPCDTLQAESLEWMKSLGLPYVTLTEILNAGPCPKVLQSIQEGIDRVNANAISNAQKVQKFAILPHDFTIPTGELGPTLKLRRNIVMEKYADIIKDFYKD